MRLLLVEDELEIQGFLQRSLTEAGYEVEAAADAGTAKRLAIERPHEALIVDLGLPDQDGLSLILRLREVLVRQKHARPLDDKSGSAQQRHIHLLRRPVN